MADRDRTQPLFPPSLSFALALPSIQTPSGTTEREAEAEAEAAAGVSDVIGRQRRAKLGVESNSSRRGRRMSTGGVSQISEGKGAHLRNFVDALPSGWLEE